MPGRGTGAIDRLTVVLASPSWPVSDRAGPGVAPRHKREPERAALRRELRPWMPWAAGSGALDLFPQEFEGEPFLLGRVQLRLLRGERRREPVEAGAIAGVEARVGKRLL